MVAGSGRDPQLRRLVKQARGLIRETRGRDRRRVLDEVIAYARPRVTASKWRWRRTHRVRPNAVPVYVVGLQRSGTSMLTRGLGASPAVQVLSEGHPAAFEQFRLRPFPVIRSIVEHSGQGYVVFKPLCDSHRILELLDGMGTPSPGRAIWAYRGVDGRVRSALGQFGANNLMVLRELAAGRGEHRWQAGGLSRQNRELIESFDYTSMTPESAAALFWYVRNSLYFDLELERRPDVALSSYDALVADPVPAMTSLCHHLGLPFERALIAHISPRPAQQRPPLPLDPEIRRRCDELQARLDAAHHAQVTRPPAGALDAR